MKEEPFEITITTTDASVMKIVQQVDGVEVDITPTPVESPVTPDKKEKKANDKNPA